MTNSRLGSMAVLWTKAPCAAGAPSIEQDFFNAQTTSQTIGLSGVTLRA